MGLSVYKVNYMFLLQEQNDSVSVIVIHAETRVSVETGSSTGLFLFITYKHFSHRRKSTDHEC